MSVAAPPRPPRVDDREALIEEARRRARRRRLGYAAALLVVLGGALGAYFGSRHGGAPPPLHRAGAGPAARGPAEEGRRIAQVAGRATIVEAGLVGPRNGWAMNGLGLWWTTDGGQRWRTITPPPIRASGDVVARATDIAAIDERHLWVAAADLAGGPSPRHMAITSTRDGGRTWHTGIPSGCADCGAAHLSFVDAARGLALVAAHPSPRLFVTSNGGATWRRFASDVSFAGPIRFVDARVGWGVSDPGGIVWRTRDAGRRWERVTFAPPRAYRAQPSSATVPRFFDARDGVVAVRFRSRSRAQHVVVYVTRDGGATWSARAAPTAVDLRRQSWGAPSAVPFSAATMDDWFLFGSRDLYTTHDGGRRWSTIRTVAPPAPRVWDVTFTSPAYGWAIFEPIPTGPRAGSALVRTTDGGRHWAPLAPR